MNKIPKQTSRAVPLWAALAIPVTWLALLAGNCAEQGKPFGAWLADFMQAINAPFSIEWTAYSGRALWIAALLYGLVIASYYSGKGNRRPGEEHGSAKWGNAKSLSSFYRDKKDPEQNILFTKHAMMGLDGRKHRHNLNVLVVGGSGSGKTRFYAKPNLMQASCSYIVADPKGEMLRSLAPLFQAKGIPITVLNLVEMKQSDGYNPFVYLRTDTDVFRLVTNLIKNTTPKSARQSDPFWDKAETALLCAFILYLKHEALPEEQNFSMVMYLIENAAAKEDDEEYKSPTDILFDCLEEVDTEHIALKEYKVFKQAAGKTAKSILISAAVRLASFYLPELAAMTDHDDMDFGSLGEQKRAIFAVIPDSDTSFNYLVGMLYSQAFQELYYMADHRYGGRLPVHVRIIMDEFANVALPDDFEHILSTCRSREISCNIIIQNIAQIKALFKDSWENITGNCDSFLYLGGNEQSTHKYISELLGKETIDTRTRGVTKGRNGSSNVNYQNAARELLTADEVRLLSNEHALLFIRGEKAVIDKKYDILKHPNIKKTGDGGAAVSVEDEQGVVLLDDLPYVPSIENIEFLEF